MDKVQGYAEPAFAKEAFNCPHCGAYAQQVFTQVFVRAFDGTSLMPSNITVSSCRACRVPAIWIDKSLAYPLQRLHLPPNDDLPDDIRADYEEAARIVFLSPRGTASLLRLCVQKLCIHLGEKGKDIDKDIASLVEKGLPETMQQALDAVRVIGNEAVHPGQMDLRDDTAMAINLFKLVNLIAENRISEPKRVQEIFSTLPPSKLQHIEDRDKQGQLSSP